MATIRVMGELYGEHNVVTEVSGVDGDMKIKFNDKEDVILEIIFRNLMETTEAMGGTYYPKEDSLLNAFRVVTRTMYSTTETIKVSGDIGTIPRDEGHDYIY